MLPAVMLMDFSHPFWTVVAVVLGACVGSFLNVVIYRVPRGMSVNQPRRSFCPACGGPIAWWHNLPVLSWLALRGRCARCAAPIAWRYVAVEVLTACLFGWVWVAFPPQAVPVLLVVVSLLVAVSFIDAEHLIIPTGMTWAGTTAGIAGALAWPQLNALGSPLAAGGWQAALGRSALGWALGFFGLWLVVLLGKALFGRKVTEFGEPTGWELREGAGEDDELQFIIGGEEHLWGDLFFRKSDRLILEGGATSVDGQPAEPGTLTIHPESIELAGRSIRIEKLKSLSGTATRVVIPREAMGMGDIHLLGMIGAVFGWPAVVFALFGGCVLALLAALVGRVGLGVHLPFGPFLALGAGGWALGGWQVWNWYLGLLRLG